MKIGSIEGIAANGNGAGQMSIGRKKNQSAKRNVVGIKREGKRERKRRGKEKEKTEKKEEKEEEKKSRIKCAKLKVPMALWRTLNTEKLGRVLPDNALITSCR